MGIKCLASIFITIKNVSSQNFLVVSCQISLKSLFYKFLEFSVTGNFKNVQKLKKEHNEPSGMYHPVSAVIHSLINLISAISPLLNLLPISRFKAKFRRHIISSVHISVSLLKYQYFSLSLTQAQSHYHNNFFKALFSPCSNFYICFIHVFFL